MSLVVFAAIGGLVFVFASPDTDDGPAPPEAVESVFPKPGDRDLRQTAIYADLAPGYTGYLLIDGIEVPLDDIQFVDALNTVNFKPTDISDFARLSSGNHCVTVVYRLIGQPRDRSESYRWCFEVH